MLKHWATAASVFVSTFIALAPADPATSDERKIGDINKVHWTSSSKQIDSVPLGIISITIGLHNLGLLPTKEVSLDASDKRAVSTIILEKYPFFYWNTDAKILMCDLNPAHCHRKRYIEVDGSKLGQIFSHISGFDEPLKAKCEKAAGALDKVCDAIVEWRFRPEFPLRIPALTFQTFAKWQPLPYPANGDLRTLYEQSSLGCSYAVETGSNVPVGVDFSSYKISLAKSTDIGCVKRISRALEGHWTFLLFDKQAKLRVEQRKDTKVSHFLELQDRLQTFYREEDLDESWRLLSDAAKEIYFEAPDSLRFVIFPVLSASLSLSVSNSTEIYSDDLTKATNSEIRGATKWVNFLKTTSFEEKMSIFKAQNLADLTFSQSSAADGRADAVMVHSFEMNDTLIKLQAERVFDVINLKYKELPAAQEMPRSLIVVDDGVDPTRCVFVGGCNPIFVRVEDLGNVAGPFASIHDRLKKEIDALNKGKGHGYGVAAVAGAKPSSLAMMGTDPDTQIVPFPFDFSDFRTEKFVQLANELNGKLASPLRVWNISGHTENKSLNIGIDNYLSQLRNRPVNYEFFVFAAGNLKRSVADTAAMNNDCDVFPACRSKDHKNAITVVGAMLDSAGIPTLWEDQASDIVSYHHSSFEIAAIAQDVVIPSATTRAFFTRSGTSYAAPQVAGIVSRMLAKLVPSDQIEARLVACGKMSTKLEPVVWGGLLDAYCSLRKDKSLVAFNPTSTQSWIDPKIANELRPGTLLGVWDPNGGAVTTFQIEAEPRRKISGNFKWWPEPYVHSLLGIRQLVDDPARVKLVVSDSTGAVTVENRPMPPSTLTLEVQFDGDTEATCIPVSNLVSFIPGLAPEVSRADQIHRSRSKCF